MGLSLIRNRTLYSLYFSCANKQYAILMNKFKIIIFTFICFAISMPCINRTYVILYLFHNVNNKHPL